MSGLYFFAVLNIDAALPLCDYTVSAKWCLDTRAALTNQCSPPSHSALAFRYSLCYCCRAINRYLNTSCNVKRGGSEHVQSSPNITEVSAEDSSRHSLHSLTGQVVVTTHLDITAYACAVSGRSRFNVFLGLKITNAKARLRETLSLSQLSPCVPAIQDAYSQREKKK